MRNDDTSLPPNDTSEAESRLKGGFQSFEARIGHFFADPALLGNALRHLSASSQHTDSNERLEFLGDGILSFLVAEMLYREYPEAGEGILTQFRSALVSTKALAEVAMHIGLPEVLITGESLENGSLSKRILAGGVEAVIAAIYLDGGIEAARAFVSAHIASRPVGDVTQEAELDNYKGLLQQVIQSFGRELPRYRVLAADGPDHRKLYKVCVEFAGMCFPCGYGSSKREAEQAAARLALDEVRDLLSENG
jgi:ribonuclease-3